MTSIMLNEVAARSHPVAQNFPTEPSPCAADEGTPGRGSLADLVGLMGGNAAALSPEQAQLAVTLRPVKRDTVLLHEGAPLHAYYVLRSGSLKCVKTLEDGYEQVVSLVHAGHLLGFEALHVGAQPFSVIGLEDATAYVLPVNGLSALRLQCAPFDEAMQLALSRQMLRASDTAEMTAAVASDIRLARFLLWTSARMASLGQSTRRLRLHICRRDIASLLGVAHETVSRSFTALSEAGYIRVRNREVEILDLEQLKARACTTRGAATESGFADHRMPLPRTLHQPVAWWTGLGESRAQVG